MPSRKYERYFNPVSRNGFSSSGTSRSQGRVGQTSLSRTGRSCCVGSKSNGQSSMTSKGLILSRVVNPTGVYNSSCENQCGNRNLYKNVTPKTAGEKIEETRKKNYAKCVAAFESWNNRFVRELVDDLAETPDDYPGADWEGFIDGWNNTLGQGGTHQVVPKSLPFAVSQGEYIGNNMMKNSCPYFGEHTPKTNKGELTNLKSEAVCSDYLNQDAYPSSDDDSDLEEECRDINMILGMIPNAAFNTAIAVASQQGGIAID